MGKTYLSPLTPAVVFTTLLSADVVGGFACPSVRDAYAVPHPPPFTHQPPWTPPEFWVSCGVFQLQPDSVRTLLGPNCCLLHLPFAWPIPIDPSNLYLEITSLRSFFWRHKSELSPLDVLPYHPTLTFWYIIVQWFSNLSMYHSQPQGLLKQRLQGPNSELLIQYIWEGLKNLHFLTSSLIIKISLVLRPHSENNFCEYMAWLLQLTSPILPPINCILFKG